MYNKKVRTRITYKTIYAKEMVGGKKKATAIRWHQVNWHVSAPRNIAEDSRPEKQHQRNYLLKHQAKDKRTKALKCKVLLSSLGSDREREINTMMDMSSDDLAEKRTNILKPQNLTNSK